MSTFLGISGNSGTFNQMEGETSNPLWVQNSRRRTIPNHLVPKKKTGFSITSSGTSKNTKKNSLAPSPSNSFNFLSFGSSQRKSSSQGGNFDASSLGAHESMLGDSSRYDETINETVNEDLPSHSFSEDVPPSRSMYDLNDEILISLSKPSQHADSFINKDPKKFQNAFNKPDLETWDAYPKEGSKNPLSNSESAILVFGYPESMASQVIQHFNEFGNILENFNLINKNSTLEANLSGKKIVPIFSGKHWTKITYDNPVSALDASQENGTVFNGVLLGVAPYSKEAVEKLQKRKLKEDEDIGDGVDFFTKIPDNDNEEKKGDLSKNQTSTFVGKMEIKDGSGLFLRAQGSSEFNNAKNEKNEKLGLFQTVSKYIFGLNEL